jgi:hypothetical protein
MGGTVERVKAEEIAKEIVVLSDGDYPLGKNRIAKAQSLAIETRNPNYHPFCYTLNEKAGRGARSRAHVQWTVIAVAGPAAQAIVRSPPRSPEAIAR